MPSKYENLPHIDGKVVKYHQVKRYFLEGSGSCAPELTALIICLHGNKGIGAQKCRPMWTSAMKCTQQLRRQTLRDDPLIKSFYQYVAKQARDPTLLKPNFK